MKITAHYRIALFVAAVAFLACADSDGILGPGAQDTSITTQSSAAKGGKKHTESATSTTGTETSASEDSTGGVQLLDRIKPLREDRWETAVIGPSGGKIAVQGGGIHLNVPEGALTSEVAITVTAIAGSKVVFDLQPHGLQFQRQVALIVKAADVAEVDGVYALYFEGDPNAGATVLEYFGVTKDGERLRFKTDHFSGYALASGSRSTKTRGYEF